MMHGVYDVTPVLVRLIYSFFNPDLFHYLNLEQFLEYLK